MTVLDYEPTVLQTGSTDAPMAVVRNFGTTELVTTLTLLSVALTAVFGQDWGLASHVQQIAAVGVIVLPVVLAAYRVLKHRGAMAVNARVAIEQLRQLDPAMLQTLLDELQHLRSRPQVIKAP